MKALVWILVIILTTVVQATIIPLMAVNGISPDLLLIIVVSASLLLGKEHGVGVGFFAGLIQDLASGNIFGLNILSKLTTGFAFGLAERKVFKEHILLPILAIAVATVFSNLVALLLLFMFGYKVDLVSAITGRIFPMVLYNMVLAIPLHKGIYKLSLKLNNRV